MTTTTDAERYQFLRNVFAIDADNDTAEFGKLARLTGSNFDAYVDAAMKAFDDKQMTKPTDWSAA